ncbi:MAG TPA: serine/threonine-protein kinase [Polyangiaceae bacterium]|nr:serine/threonine-protein kinase [Polyangiaceae bacterium]
MAHFRLPVEAPDLMRRARARVGTMLRGKWHLDSILGTGGMATVYEATHRNGTRGAIKVLHPELALRSDIVDRFVREGYHANKVGHSGAVRIIDDDVDQDGTVYLVMELLCGETLEGRRERKGGRLDLDDVLCIVERVLGVLKRAHEHGVVHCDLKPENLYVTDSGIIKVLDFGMAGLLESAPSIRGIPAGTPSFMPPEQAHGKWDEVDARTDIWALGATMFTLLTGTYLRNAQTWQEQLWDAATQPVASLAETGLDFPPQVIRLVDKALLMEPHHRWQDADSMRMALRDTWTRLHSPALAVTG